ncbi:DUF58 domain-containing protein, partial [Planctomyces bekefii]
MLSPEVLKQIRGLELKAGHLVTEAMAGNYVSAFKGRGMEFDEVREYVPGDDIRSIDWNVTARMRQPFVKVLKEEREQTLMLMVDVSPSQMFGTTGRKKQEMAAEMAAVLAFLAIRNNDKVGLVVFSDHVEEFIPPKKGRGHVFRIISTVLTHQGSGKTTDINQALQYTMQMLNRKSLLFVISDFWAKGFEQQLKMAGRRHDVVCVRTLDPIEAELPRVGFLALRDLETGEEVIVDSSDREVGRRFMELVRKRD